MVFECCMSEVINPMNMVNVACLDAALLGT